MAKNRRQARGKRNEQSRRQVKRIDVLPDDILLEVFHSYMIMHPSLGSRMAMEAWQLLVHVCRRWRSLVFGSPRHLNVRLFCTPDTPAQDTSDLWPALPLIVWGGMRLNMSSGTDNIIAALEQSNRVCEVCLLHLADWQLEKVLAAMQVPFPELTDLQLLSDDETPPAIDVIPGSFLNGSAPRLRSLYLEGIPFPGLPKLLLSATHLVELWLSDIPHSGYISPDTMAAPLSVLSNLETLYLEFRSPQFHPDRESRSLPPPSRSILPALKFFLFKGVVEYFEKLVTHIDTPQLHDMPITFFNRINFDCPRLNQFINRTPTLGARDTVFVRFGDSTSVTLQARSGKIEIVISWSEPDRQLSPIAQVCNTSLHPLSMIEVLYIERQPGEQVFQIDAIESTQWLRLLLPFTAVKYLCLSKECAPGIAAALQGLVGDRITDVLPSLEDISVEWPRHEPWGAFRENIEQFVAARQLSDHPISLSVQDEDSDLGDVK